MTTQSGLNPPLSHQRCARRTRHVNLAPLKIDFRLRTPSGDQWHEDGMRARRYATDTAPRGTVRQHCSIEVDSTSTSKPRTTGRRHTTRHFTRARDFSALSVSLFAPLVSDLSLPSAASSVGTVADYRVSRAMYTASSKRATARSCAETAPSAVRGTE